MLEYFTKSLNFIFIPVVSLLICFTASLSAQESNKSKAKFESEQIQISYEKASQLFNESYSLQKKDWKHSLDLAKEAYDICKLNSYDELTGRILLVIGEITYYHVDRDSAKEYFEEGLEYAISQDDFLLQYKIYLELAEWHMYRSKDYVQSDLYFNKSIETGRNIDKGYSIGLDSDFSRGKDKNYLLGRVFARKAILDIKAKNVDGVKMQMDSSEYYFLKEGDAHAAAYYYCDLGVRLWEFDMQNAVEFYIKGLELDENHYFVNLCIGNAYISLGLPEISIPHLTLALDSLSMDEWRYGICNNNLAEAYVQLEKYNLADSICDFNISHFVKEGDRTQRCLSRSYLLKGQIQELAGDEQTAVSLYERSFEESEKTGGSIDRTNSLLALGKYYLDKDVEKAITYCNEAYDFAVKYNYGKSHAQACECLYLAQKDKKNFEKSIAYLEEKEKLEFSLNKDVAVNKLEVFGKLSLREKENSYQQQLKDEQLRSQRIANSILQFALLIGTLLILLLFRMLKRIKKQNAEINTQSDILKATNSNLTQSNEELERFAYIVSHDLKTPLLNIVQFTKLLSKKLDDSSKPIIRECIEHIESGGTRMMSLIEDVLGYSKLSDLGGKTENINIANLLNEISGLLLSKHNNATILFDENSLPVIKWNYTKLLLLFKNLIENGLKYNKSEVPTIKVYSEHSATEVRVYIEDNGIGVEKEYFDKIFVMFSRLHTQRIYEGSGLGLATCKKIVSDFSGEISLESKPSKGSIFMVSFPREMIEENEQKQEKEFPQLEMHGD